MLSVDSIDASLFYHGRLYRSGNSINSSEFVAIFRNGWLFFLQQ